MPSQSELKRIPIFMGRWQPFHMGHFFVAKELLRDYQDLLIGIVAPDPDHPPETYEKFHPKENPYSYWQRMEMVRAAFQNDPETKSYTRCLKFIPVWGMATHFVREESVLPPRSRSLFILTSAKDDSYGKIAILERITKDHRIINEIPDDVAGIDAIRLRKKILNGDESWKQYVPKGVDALLEQRDYMDALEKSVGKEWPAYLNVGYPNGLDP